MNKTALMALMVAFFLSNHVQAEIYTWVDEKGNKHFGDKIPLKYKGQFEKINIEYRQPSVMEINKAKERKDKVIRVSNQLEKSKGDVVIKSAEGNDTLNASSGCKKLKDEDRKRCSSVCQLRFETFYDGVVCYDKPACKYCLQMGKPRTTALQRSLERKKEREDRRKKRKERLNR